MIKKCHQWTKRLVAMMLVLVMSLFSGMGLVQQVMAAETSENQINSFDLFTIKDANGNVALNVKEMMKPTFSPEVSEYNLIVPEDKVGENWNTINATTTSTTNGWIDNIATTVTLADGQVFSNPGSWGSIMFSIGESNLIPAEGQKTVITMTTPEVAGKNLSSKTYTFNLIHEVKKPENQFTKAPKINVNSLENVSTSVNPLPEFNPEIDSYAVELGENDNFNKISVMVEFLSSGYVFSFEGFESSYTKADGTVITGKPDRFNTWLEFIDPNSEDFSPAPGESAFLTITTPETDKYAAKTYTWEFKKAGNTALEGDSVLNQMIIKNQDGRDISGYLVPGFKGNVFNYTLAVPKGITMNGLDLQGILADGSPKEISGKMTLQDQRVIEGQYKDGHLILSQDQSLFASDEDQIQVEVTVSEKEQSSVYQFTLKREMVYDAGEEEVPEDVYFLTKDGHKIRMGEDRTFVLDQNAEGQFIYQKATDEMQLEWQNSRSNFITIYADQGELEATGPDEVGVDAWVTEKGQGTHLADFRVKTVAKKYSDFRLKIDDTFVSLDHVNVPYSISGDAQKKIDVYALVQGEESLGYRKISGRKVNFTATPEGIVKIYNQANENRGVINFLEQDKTAVVKAEFEEQPELSRSFMLTNVFVPVTGIRFHLPEVFYMDEWNTLSDQWVGIVQAGGVYPEDDTTYQIDVQPMNATNKKTHAELSNDDTVIWSQLHGNGIVPLKRGEVTITVISDENPDIRVEKTVRIEYKHPLEKIEGAEQKDLTFKVGDVKDLGLVFSPENTTEKRMNWSYDQEGIVGIDSARNGKNTLTAISAGTVKVTGTPVDDTNSLKPVVFNVTVEEDGSGMPDVSSDVDHGIQVAQKYLSQEQYTYGDEWNIFALLRSGYTIEPSVLEAYYADVCEAVKDSRFANGKITDIERLALTIDAMGKDARNVGGVDLIDLISRSSRLESQGSNGLAFGLLALDAKQYTVADDALWNRDKIIDALMPYQNQDGGFTLSKGSDSDVDMTAMVLQALAKYQDRSDVKAATDRALDYLKGQMSFQGTFKEGSTESAVQVLTALTELKIDPMDPTNGFTKGKNSIISGLMKNCVGDEGFSMFEKDQKVNAMSTQQALYGLAAYVRLTKGQNSLYDLRAEMNPDEKAAQAVIDQINGLGAITGLDQKKEVETVRAAYENLTEAQKAYVSAETLKVLTDAEAKIAEIEQALADQEAAQAVIDQINGLGAITGLNQKKEVEAARAAYDKLTEAQKAYVSPETLKVLTDAETKLAELEQGQKPENQKPGDQTAGKPDQGGNGNDRNTHSGDQKVNVSTGVQNTSAGTLAAVVILCASAAALALFKKVKN